MPLEVNLGRRFDSCLYGILCSHNVEEGPERTREQGLKQWWRCAGGEGVEGGATGAPTVTFLH